MFAGLGTEGEKPLFRLLQQAGIAFRIGSQTAQQHFSFGQCFFCFSKGVERVLGLCLMAVGKRFRLRRGGQKSGKGAAGRAQGSSRGGRAAVTRGQFRECGGNGFAATLIALKADACCRESILFAFLRARRSRSSTV